MKFIIKLERKRDKMNAEDIGDHVYVFGEAIYDSPAVLGAFINDAFKQLDVTDDDKEEINISARLEMDDKSIVELAGAKTTGKEILKQDDLYRGKRTKLIFLRRELISQVITALGEKHKNDEKEAIGDGRGHT